MPKFALRRDDNDAELVKVAEKCGAKIIRQPPLEFWILWRSEYIPVEIKRPDKEGWKDEFTKAQLAFFNLARAYGGRWLVWRTVDDVLRDLGKH